MLVLIYTHQPALINTDLCHSAITSSLLLSNWGAYMPETGWVTAPVRARIKQSPTASPWITLSHSSSLSLSLPVTLWLYTFRTDSFKEYSIKYTVQPYEEHDMMQWVRMNDGVYKKIVIEVQSWLTNKWTRCMRCVRCIHIPSSPDKPRIQGISLYAEESRSSLGREMATGDEPPPLFIFLVLPFFFMQIWNGM